MTHQEPGDEKEKEDTEEAIRQNGGEGQEAEGAA
jgi:hypothetical protein